MSQASAATPVQVKSPGIRRLWMPLTVFVLAALGMAGVWLFAGDALDMGQKRFFTFATVVVSLLLVTAWIVLFSGLSWLFRGMWILLLVAAAVSLRVDFDGDMKPSFSVWWLDQQLAKLEAQRATQKPIEGKLELDGAGPLDVPAFRGVLRNGIIDGPPLETDWKTNPPQMLWKQPAGGGYAGFVGVGPAIFTIEQRGDKEAVVCYDAATGTERWKYDYDAKFVEALGGPGPRATPTFFDGKIYSLGAKGHLACLDAATGRMLWSQEILKDNSNVMWGMSGSPLVLGDLVIVNPGAQTEAKKGQALLALDRTTGEPRWASGTTQAGYSSPQLATLAGVQQVLLFDGEGIGGYDLTDGRRLWFHPYPTYQGINVAQPVVMEGDRVLISAGYNVGSELLHITKAGEQWEAKSLWKERSLMSKFASPVLFEDHLYGLDDGILACFEATTGKRKWKGGRYGHGQILLSNGTLFVQCETGEIALVRATPEKHDELAKLKVFDDNKTWNTPLLMDGRAYVRSATEMAAFDLRRTSAPVQEPGSVPASAPEVKD